MSRDDGRHGARGARRPGGGGPATKQGSGIARRVAVVACTAALVLAGTGSCAYYNALYNAKRQFAEAERAAARGDQAMASMWYEESIQRAARSYRRSPDGRWADDAMYLIGRAHYGRRNYAAARGALIRVLSISSDESIRSGALAYLGATEFMLNEPDAALGYLDEALQSRHLDEETAAFARRWRGSIRLLRGAEEAGRQDLELGAAGRGPSALEARIELVRLAVRRDDSPETAYSAFQRIFDEPDGQRWADTLALLAREASINWDAATARSLLEPASQAAWPPRVRDGLVLERARLAAAAGDTAAALSEVRSLADRTTGRVSEDARILAARWVLATATELDAVDQVRSVLLPAVGRAEATEIVQAARTMGVLLERAVEGRQGTALFAAAELARDELRAPHLARTLFIAFADAAMGTEWEPKALLAAAALGPSPAQEARIRQGLANADGNVYVRAARGEDPGSAYELAEQRLSRQLMVMVQTARQDAQRRDLVVARTLAVLDTARAQALADSLRPHCEAIRDSLDLRGERGDSIFTACLRADRPLVDSLIRLDSIARDTLRGDTVWPPVTDTARAGVAPADYDGFIPLEALRRAGGPSPEPRP